MAGMAAVSGLLRRDRAPSFGADEGHRFDPTILREYDVRGVVGDTLTERDAYALGRAYAAMLRERGGRRVCVGYDGRTSSPALEAALAMGLAVSGVDVARIGLASTPTLYFAVCDMEADGGVMVTGSHNPPAYNGFKMMLGRGALYGDAIRRLGRIAAEAEFVTGAGDVIDAPMLERHAARILADNPVGRPLKAVWDPGHGAPAAILPALTAGLPGEHILINCEVDARFPAHHPDPTRPENLVQLQEKVLETGADVGFAFDGDGDRIGVVDGEGQILWADQLLVLLAQDLLSRRPGATIIADVKASQCLFDSVESAGGAAMMWKTGHSLIKARMAETGAPLAGEMSGHIFFAEDYYGFDDGLYAAVKTLSILAGSGRSLADFRRSLPDLRNTPELRFPCPEERKFGAVAEAARRLAAAGADIIDVDGLRVRLEDGWWLLRASNTEDALVGRCEGDTDAGLARAKAALAQTLEDVGVEPTGL